MYSKMSNIDLNAVNEEIGLQMKARKEIILNKYKKIYNLKFELGLLGTDPFGKPYQDLRDKITDLKKMLEAKDTSLYMWITISIDPEWMNEWLKPDDPESLLLQENMTMAERLPAMNDELMRKAQKFASSKMFSDYLFVIEQRKSDFNAHRVYCGQHFHFLVRRNPQYPPSQIDRNTRRVWRDYCDTSKTPKDARTPCHILQCPQKYVNDKIAYIMGTKTGKKKNGEEKSKIQAIDKTFRKHFNFKDFYFPDVVREDPRFKKALEENIALGGNFKI